MKKLISDFTGTIIAGVGNVCEICYEQISGGAKKIAGGLKRRLASSTHVTNEEVKTEFLQVADKFMGIYESLYVEALNESGIYSHEVIDDWNTRVKYLSSQPHFQAYWEENKNDLRKVIAFFETCGVERDNLLEICATEQTRYCYQVLSEERIDIGQKYSIVLPCWKLQNKILEKGIIKPIRT